MLAEKHSIGRYDGYRCSMNDAGGRDGGIGAALIDKESQGFGKAYIY